MDLTADPSIILSYKSDLTYPQQKGSFYKFCFIKFSNNAKNGLGRPRDYV